MVGGPGDEKVCDRCGRVFAWRKKWERDWGSVRYCSNACRRAGLREVDGELERVMLEMIRARGRGTTVCPSEVARAVGDEDSWRGLMEPARMAARRLVARGAAVMTQGGRAVDPSTARGPVRVGVR